MYTFVEREKIWDVAFGVKGRQKGGRQGCSINSDKSTDCAAGLRQELPELGGLAIDWHGKEKGGGKENRHAREENLGLGYKPSSVKINGRVIIKLGREGGRQRSTEKLQQGRKESNRHCWCSGEASSTK